MKKSLLVLFSLLFFIVPVRASEAGRFPPQLLTFSAAKEQQVRQLAKDLNLAVPQVVSDFFKSAEQGDCAAVTNTIEQLGPQFLASFKDTNHVPSWIPFWQPMTEVESAYEAFAAGGTKYPLAFGEGIIQSIPAGSIYFGGSDSGRMLVTALCQDHAQGKPFFTLTQNALSDGRYMDYLRAMYGKQISLPTTNDVQAALEDYKADALRRLKHDEEFPDGPRQIKQGESVRLVNGELQMNNPVSVMAVHARLVKLMLERNPNREFYLEESYPLELIYPYLSPHGLIFQLNHAPLTALPVKDIEADHAFWTKECGTLLGGWLKPDTSVSNVCAFAEAVYGRKDRSQFSGDKEYVTNDFAPPAFSKLRVSIAGMYQWRLMNHPGAAEKVRLEAEADYAFRQAFALCPTSREALYRSVNFLLMESRIDDAIQMAGTACKLTPNDEQYENLLTQLKGYGEQMQMRKAAETVSPLSTNAASLSQETMSPARFREIVGMPGDAVPLAPQLAAVPFWTNAVVSNVMTYASGKVFREEMTQTARTVDGKYVVFIVQSKFYNQPMNSILTYNAKASALKVYGLYGNGPGGDIVTESTAVYDFAKKTYTITSSYGDGFKETTTGSYTDTEDSAKTVGYKEGVLFMTREVKTRPIVAGK